MHAAHHVYGFTEVYGETAFAQGAQWKEAISSSDFLVITGTSSVFGGIAGDEQEERAFVGWTAEDLGEKAHRTGRVGECGDAGMVQSGDEHASRDTDGLSDVVVLGGFTFVSRAQ